MIQLSNSPGHPKPTDHPKPTHQAIWHLRPPLAAFPPATRRQRPAPRVAAAPGDGHFMAENHGKTMGKW